MTIIISRANEHSKGLWEDNFHWIELAARVSREAQCKRAHCGAVIVAPQIGGYLGPCIGMGFNRPPGGFSPRCDKRTFREGFKSDRTCCIHAEQVAILEALKTNPTLVPNSILYFCRTDMETGEMIPSGEPYCTICSKMALDVGISQFVLWHGEKMGIYSTDAYNEQSFEYGTGPLK